MSCRVAHRVGQHLQLRFNPYLAQELSHAEFAALKKNKTNIKVDLKWCVLLSLTLDGQTQHNRGDLWKSLSFHLQHPAGDREARQVDTALGRGHVLSQGLRVIWRVS